jgi:hypothetical protein
MIQVFWYILTILTEFDAYQAQSLLNYVIGESNVNIDT